MELTKMRAPLCASAVLIWTLLTISLGEEIDLSKLPKKEIRMGPDGYPIQMVESGLLSHILTYPPKLIKQGESEIAYKVGDKNAEKIEIPCKAQGDPEPEYKWEKDGQPMMITGTDVKRIPGEGSLIIEEPLDEHEGVYQCFASNAHGIALSIKTILKKAVLEPFDSVREPKVHRPEIGESLTLNCHPPKSYPSGQVYWGESTPGARFQPLTDTVRRLLDYNGNLHFANIERKDSLFGSDYVCIVYNTVLRGLVQGDDQRIQPQGPATPQYRAPQVMWTSEERTIAIKGRHKYMKCIFAGYPTPKVTWTRLDNKDFPERADPERNFGTELLIRQVDFEDEGRYRCSATNMEGGTPVSRDFHLIVESMPFWVEEVQSVNTAEEENAEFKCRAGGKPKPSVSWTINGMPVEQLDSDGRREITAESIKYTNVSKTDSQVIQCNATNKHGYIFSNAYLNVLAEPPTFITIPEAVTKVAEAQTTTLSCRVFGAPKPIIIWKYEEQRIEDNRFTVTEDGDLIITNAQKGDEGNYECEAYNKFGREKAGGQLIVRERTIINLPPEDQTVNASTNVEFVCTATTDPMEAAHLEVKWLRNGEEIDFENEKTLRLKPSENKLIVTSASVEDSGEYTCVASNGLDEDRVTALLKVKDKPDPPKAVNLDACLSANAEITWVPGNENNDMVIEYLVYYNTSFDAPGEFHLHAKSPRSDTYARIPLTPWANYTFHVQARNSLGISDPSAFSAVCTTQPQRPTMNPRGVCTESRSSDQLVIVWEIMEKIDHNGEDFRYEVAYKRRDIPDAPWEKKTVSDWQENELIVEGVETFKEYELYVQAVNREGSSPESRLLKMVGHSGEGTPTESPRNLHIDPEELNATSAVFVWDPIDMSPEVIQGLFTGYEIHFWREDEPEDVRIHSIPVQSGEFCRRLNNRHDIGRSDNHRGKRQAEDTEERAHVMNLWPFSKISAAILAKNSKNSGSLSSPAFSFTTPQGVPGIVILEVRERGSHHLGVHWGPPIEPNGILVGYTIGYQEADDTTAPLVTEFIMDPLRRSLKLKRLKDNQSYRLYIWAHSEEGQGATYYIEDATLPAGAPDIPGFANIEAGDNYINVSWVPTDKGPTKNPGSEFYVEYRKVSDGPDAPWDSTEPEEDVMWANVSGLETGEQYEVRVVAINGRGEETRSPAKKVQVGPGAVTESGGAAIDGVGGATTQSAGVVVGEATAEPQIQRIATAGWFIGMMCAILFLLIILLIVCLIKRNKGAKYSVSEKEKLRGNDPDKEDEEGGFGEYTKTPPQSKVDEPDYKKSAGSLESNPDSMRGSDIDSMAEYDDTDPNKFNEDGSFIGQYGGKTKKDDKMEPDATSPSALSTFV